MAQKPDPRQEELTRIGVILSPDRSALILQNTSNDAEIICRIIRDLSEDLLGAGFQVTHSRSGVRCETFRKRRDQKPLYQLDVGLSGEINYLFRTPPTLPASGPIVFVESIKGCLLGVLAFAGECYRCYGLSSTIHMTVTLDKLSFRSDPFSPRTLDAAAERLKLCEVVMPQVRALVAAWNKAKEHA